MTNEIQELQRRIRELTEQNAFLTGIIDRAMTKFCEDGSDGAIAAEMFRIENDQTMKTQRPSAGSADSELNRNNEMNEPETQETNPERPPALAGARCYALAATIARAIFATGDEPGSPCKRIQFQGGKWPDNERNQGGIGETPLVAIIAAQLEAHNDQAQPRGN